MLKKHHSGRKTPSKALKRAIIAKQEGRCGYCNSSLVGEQMEWDHFEPFSYIGNQTDSNWVACCKLCNRLKSAKVLKTDEDIYDFCLRMVKDHGSFEEGWPEGSSTEWPELCV